MENLELLVKLASVGTAGVCVLAVFIIGTSIFKLPANTPAWKVSLMKKYMNTCILIAVICAISGGANAYFSQAKIAKANNNFDKLSAAYEGEIRKVELEKKAISSELVSLRVQLQQNNNLSSEAAATLRNTEVKVDRLQLAPRESIIENITPARIKRVE